MGAGLSGSSYRRGQRGTGEDLGLSLVRRHGLHGFARFLLPLETVQHFISTLHHLFGNVALMGNANISHRIAAYRAIADEAKRPGQHLITTRAIVWVQKDDFIGVAVIPLIGMVQANHVFGMFPPVFVAYASLRRHEGFKTSFRSSVSTAAVGRCSGSNLNGFRLVHGHKWTEHG